MIVAIHQPHYLPWLRYLDKLASADVFILLDDTQYTKNGWQNRNRIKGPRGPILLTVPVKAPAFKPICSVEIDGMTPWAEKHWKSLRYHYGKAPFFRHTQERFEDLYAQPWTSLSALNLHLIRILVDAFGLKTSLVASSSMAVPGRGTERLIALCRKVGADQYLTGAYAAGNHLDGQQFAEAGIEVSVQAWECPTYSQQFPAAGFIPDLSALDLLFNKGPRGLDLLAGHRSARSRSFAVRF